MIFVMGISMLKMDRAKATWRVKIERAFDKSKGRGSGRWVLFLLPFVTLLREGTYLSRVLREDAPFTG